MNGTTEAIDEITKKELKTVVQDSLFTEEMLAAYLTETESLINARPLIPISDNLSDMKTLTPNYFLLSRNQTSTFRYHRIMSATLVRNGILYKKCYQYFGTDG